MLNRFKYTAPLALTAMVAMSAPSLAADYVIDSKNAHASINFRIKHLGYSWLTGRFDTFSGQYSFDAKAPEKSTISVEVDTNSVNSNHAKRDNHLRSADFLDVGKHPKATFKSTSVKVTGDKTAIISGKLTLRGVTKDIDINATFVGGGKDPWGGYRTGFTGTARIALADFGINFNLGPASKVVDLQLEIEGVQKK